MPTADLTPFGFTPTESRVYQVMLADGGGTGYAIARTAGLARANAYSALEGLVAKGAARSEGGRPKRYYPEPPDGLIAMLAHSQGAALDQLSRVLEADGTPVTPSTVVVETPRGALQLVYHALVRETSSIVLLAPAEAYPVLAPSLKRSVGTVPSVTLLCPGVATIEGARVEHCPVPSAWPGEPLICVVDARRALIVSRRGNEVRGHWSTEASFVAAATLVLEMLRRSE